MKKPQKAAKKSQPAKKPVHSAKKTTTVKAVAKKNVPAAKATVKPSAKKSSPVAAKSSAKVPAKKAMKEVKKTTPVALAKKANDKHVKKVMTPVKPGHDSKKDLKKKPILTTAPAKKQAPIIAAKSGKVVDVKSAKKVSESTKKVESPKKVELPKKLTKAAEKELLKKGKSKKAETFEEELLEELEAKSREDEGEDDDFDDFETAAAPKVKMTFDEEFEEEIPVRKKKVSLDDDIKENLAEEILSLSEDFKIEDIFASIRNMDLFKVESDECVVRGCDNPSTTSGYCRYHYIKFWKDVKKKEAILSEGRLAKIIEDLVRKFPVKYIETIIQDLADDKAFSHVLKDLDIETDAEDLDTFEDDELLDDDQDIAFETKVTKPSFDD